MGRTRRAHYGAVVGIALVVAALLVTVAGEWQTVQSALNVLVAVLVFALLLKAFSITAVVLLRSLV